MDYDGYKYSDLTDKIIRAFYHVYNELGYGFLEKVYERALIIELGKMNLSVQSQVGISVYYEGQEVGLYYADILVEGVVILELKAGQGFIEEHEAQLINYLKATDIEIGLLLNFGVKPVVKRKIFSNN